MLDEIGIEGLTISNSEDMSTQLTEQFIMEHQRWPSECPFNEITGTEQPDANQKLVPTYNFCVIVPSLVLHK